MSNNRFELYPTIVTPFTDENKIDYTALEKLIAIFAHNKCDGIFAVCQSSEMFFLSEEEKFTLADFCISTCKTLGIECVVSGHTQDELDEQIDYLKKLEKLNPDAIILVSNRLASEDETDEILIDRMEKIVGSLKPDTKLGVYECPYPYKRLLSEKVIKHMAESGRFTFVKDTCCDIEIIKSRLSYIKDTGIKLFNANSATLLESAFEGAAGYSGVMLNFIPEIFMQLKIVLEERGHNTGFFKQTANEISDFISAASAFEYQNYPRNAKYYLMEKGVFQNYNIRTSGRGLTVSQKMELKALSNRATKEFAKYNQKGMAELIFPENKFFGSCHASTILSMDNGTILVTYFAGTREGAPDVGIWLSKRVQGVWQDPVCIANEEGIAHWNPVIFNSPEGIRIVYRVGNSVTQWKSQAIVSNDLGETWCKSNGLDSTDDQRGPVRNKPILLSCGDLLAPNSIETSKCWFPIVDVSYDNGASFEELSSVEMNLDSQNESDYISGKGAIQPTLWESEPGCVHMLLRTTCGKIFRSDSSDCGKTWCKAYNTFLPNNNSGIDIAKHKDDLYLVLNPISGNWQSRTPIVIYKSSDNGKTFNFFRTLDSQETDTVYACSAEFSYPAAIVEKDTLYITYTHLRRQIAFWEIKLS